MTSADVDRFWSKVDKSGECWTWTAAHNLDGSRNVGAHRYVWMVERGPIPDGLTIDHLCRTRNCVRVEHMEVVTRGENSRRGGGLEKIAAERRNAPECKHGHPFTPENTYTDPRGRRVCIACRRRYSAAWRKTHRNRRPKPLALGDMCKNGHEMTLENTLFREKGRAVCRTCDRERALAYYHRTKASK
jgi:hypothetical protein